MVLNDVIQMRTSAIQLTHLSTVVMNASLVRKDKSARIKNVPHATQTKYHATINVLIPQAQSTAEQHQTKKYVHMIYVKKVIAL